MRDSWCRSALLSALFQGGLALLATPVEAQHCPQPCFNEHVHVHVHVHDEEVDVHEEVDGDVVGNPVEPGSGSGYENLGGMAPDASPSPGEVHLELTATTGWEIVETDDACANNFDLNDRLGTRHGGPNTDRPRHGGVDIQGNPGDNIRAWKGGSLSAIKPWDRLPSEDTLTPCGHGVQINHTDGSLTRFCHLQTLPRTSGWISAGQVVGQVGNTGRSDGPHAHVLHELANRKRAEYFDHTSDRPAASQLNPGGC